MSILPASSIGDESTGFYGTKINQSLRFNDGDSPRLSKTFGSGGSRFSSLPVVVFVPNSDDKEHNNSPHNKNFHIIHVSF